MVTFRIKELKVTGFLKEYFSANVIGGYKNGTIKKVNLCFIMNSGYFNVGIDGIETFNEKVKFFKGIRQYTKNVINVSFPMRTFEM